jgi:hypothetical protein
MFSWYQKSSVCYTYLVDVEANHSEIHDIPEGGHYEETEYEKLLNSQFARSRWFNRVWTLQELIAPRAVEFFDRTFNYMGSSSSLCRTLSIVTRIDTQIFQSTAEDKLTALQLQPLAVRMSWAADRGTTRVEDSAY